MGCDVAKRLRVDQTMRPRYLLAAAFAMSSVTVVRLLGAVQSQDYRGASWSLGQQVSS